MSLVLVAAAILLLLVLLVSAILVVPFDVSFKVAGGRPAFAGEVSVRWLGLRLVRREISGREEVEKAPSREKRKPDPIAVLRLLREAAPSFGILLRALKKSISLRRLAVEVNLGLDDPARTAELSGYVWSVAWLANLLPNTSFAFTPVFGGPTLEGSAAASLRVRLLPLVAAFLRAYSKKSFRAFLREVRR